jgi:hypothetical protein
MKSSFAIRFAVINAEQRNETFAGYLIYDAGRFIARPAG